MADEAPPFPTPQVDETADPIILCPYCGRTQRGGDRCAQCGGLFEPLSRMATQIAMGPWFIRDKLKPFQPGCSFETLKKMAERGRLKPITVMRGPTTHQFWSVARNVPGVAHLIGFCYHCGGTIRPGSLSCPRCDESWEEPRDRNALGLQYPTQEAVQAAKRELEARTRARKRVSARLRESEESDDFGFSDELIEESLQEARERLASAEGADQTGMGMVVREDPSDELPTDSEMVADPAVESPAPAAPETVDDKVAEGRSGGTNWLLLVGLLLLAVLIVAASLIWGLGALQ